MSDRPFTIGVVAPASRIEPEVAERVKSLARAHRPDAPPEVRFHPQCHLTAGHFAGDDAARAAAFLDIANDPQIDAVWFARGGYGACRIIERVLPELGEAARAKTYLGYSDAGSLLGALYNVGVGHVAHGPIPADILRKGGDAAVIRGLDYLIDRSPGALEPSVGAAEKTAAFNITILSQLLGTPYQPDLAGHVLMLEEVSEHMYRIDRALFHITSNLRIREVAGLRLGRCSDIPENDPDFGLNEVEVAQHWCAASGIAYLGRADIGHDVENKVVPFGRA